MSRSTASPKRTAGVFLIAEDGAEGLGDFTGREGAGCDLIEEGLEEMEIAAVDERHVDGGATEGFSGVETAETAAEDYDAMHLLI